VGVDLDYVLRVLRVVPERLDEGLRLDLAHADLVHRGEERKLVLHPLLPQHEVDLGRGLRALQSLAVQHLRLQLLDALAGEDEGLGHAAVPAAVAGGDQVRDAARLQDVNNSAVKREHQASGPSSSYLEESGQAGTRAEDLGVSEGEARVVSHCSSNVVS
jgi:hypothetical protein